MTADASRAEPDEQHRHEPDTGIASMRNLGPASARMLAAISIHTATALDALGAAGATGASATAARSA